MTSFTRCRLLATTMIAGMAIASPAYAQDQGTPAETTAGVQTQDAIDEGAQGEEIVVTGTLLRNPNLEASSPVAVVGQDEIQLRQTNTAEQILRELPGATPNLGGNVNNGSVGGARVDLRGLGPNRNIVLLDNRRVTPSSFNGVFDLNNIPLALLERVDVLTGGASTTYGADAVSGVVNFITRRDFAGMDLQASQQITERGDGNVFRADLVLGANFDDGRGNAVLALGYQEADPIFFGDRDTAICTIPSTTGVCGGDSPTAVPVTIDLPGPTPGLQLDPTGTQLIPQYSFFNFNPFNVFTTPFERFNFVGQARYEVSDAVEVYSRGLFSKNTVQTIIAASGIFGNSLTVPSNNPFLSPALRNQICTAQGISTTSPDCTNNPALPLGLVYRRSVELGPRISTYVTQIFDVLAGARYKFTDSLELDVYGAYGESENDQTLSGYVANSRVQQALNATSPTTCLVTTNNCVPLNLFGSLGSITPEMGAFIGGITSTITLTSSLAQAHAVLSGDFGSTLPWASEPIGFAIGGEYREYHAARIPDNLAQVPGELGGAGGATLPFAGSFHVYEAFGEVILPVVADRPFFNELTVEAGVRYSAYTVDAPNKPTFDSTTYKIGVNWEPLTALKLRGNYQRAVRAPNIGELFAPVVQSLTNLLVDPCQGAAPTTNANLRAVCIAQGAPASSIGSIQAPAAGQANITIGGNPNLQPEKATTYTLGAVIQPEGFLDGFTATVDYYNIEIKDAITSPAVADTLAFCFNNLSASSATSAACTSIRRNAANGRLSGTSTAANPIPGLPGALSNEGYIKTDGIDLTLNYRRNLGFAELNLNFAGNYTFNSEFRSRPGGVLRECVGLFSANCGISTGLTSGTGLSVGSPLPQYTWNQRTTLSFESVDVSLLWRHIDGLSYEGLEDDFAARGFTESARKLFEGTITGQGPLVGQQVNFNKIPSYNYFDLSARFSVTDNFELTLTVMNLLDKDPPIVGSSAGSTAFNGGNTYPSTYDTSGRRYAATARLKF